VDGNDISQGKPDPELFLKAADQMHVQPSSCLVVEDAESGIQAARAAGMPALGIGNPRNLGGAQAVVSGLDKIDLPAINRMLA
jgi:beta-phosphoglucomutase